MTDKLLRVTDVAPSGAGIAYEDGVRIFVPGTLPGDVVRADVTPPARGSRSGVAVPLSWETESPWRRRTPCPASRSAPACGGCALATLSPEGQAFVKRRLLTEALAEAGVEAPDPLPLMEAETLGADFKPGFRNKAVLYPSLNAEGHWQFTLYAQGSHEPVPASVDCPQTPDWMAEAAKRIAAALDDTALTPWNEPLLTGDIRALLMREGVSEHSPERLVALVVRDETPAVRAFADTLCALLDDLTVDALWINRHPAAGNAVLGREGRPLTPRESIRTTIGGLTFEVRPETFLQVNPSQTERLYAVALDWASIGADDVFLDLYCGIGTMTLLGARRAAKAVGVELVEASIDRAKVNAELNGISNADFFAGAVEHVLPGLITRGLRPTTAIVDPAFKGLDETVPAMLTGLGLKRFVYVSCSPKSFARDAARFIKLGWRIERLVPVDLFPGALHVETVAKFVRD